MTDANKPTGLPLPEALAGNFQDAVRWFNQLWSGAAEPAAAGRGAGGALPSMLMPTLDVKELEKRIADLRSVENWLNLNLNLLRTTIQGLEMQRSTLAAWQALGAAGPSAKPEGGAGAAAPEAPAFQPAVWWAALQQQFAQMAASAAAQAAAVAGPSAQSEAAAPSAAAQAAPGSGKSPGKPKSGGSARG